MVCMTAVPVPDYLSQTYWWAYVHPNAVRLFERRWLVNLILFGNLRRLADAAIAALGGTLPGRTLQVGCVYGDLTPRICERVPAGGRLDVADVLPVQLENLARKLAPGAPVRLVHGDSTRLDLAAASYDRALVFFLLHEQPAHARRATLAEALRLLKPGGCLVIVDYHRPRRWNPLYWPMAGILRSLEPYAMDLWEHDISEWLPRRVERLEKTTAFGGLYQIVRLTV
jgi:ubiquinone/menaquinone biosynthesis C-methylase UbiE